jgi:hypothetical protein
LLLSDNSLGESEINQLEIWKQTLLAHRSDSIQKPPPSKPLKLTSLPGTRPETNFTDALMNLIRTIKETVMAPDKIYLVPAFPATELSVVKAMQKFFGQ